MAIYHLNMRAGSRNGGQSAAAAAAYITRTGPYARDPDELVYTASGNLPAWASTDAAYWAAADLYERANGRLFQRIEFALPLELDERQQCRAAREFAERVAGIETMPWTLAVHRGAGTNPHCHLLISENVYDGLDRDPETWFRRHNPRAPEKGGARKGRALRGRDAVSEIRASWSEIANAALERAGAEARIDHRSYADQGIDLAPGIHLGPHVQAMEEKGFDTDRGAIQRQRERLRARQRERAQVDAEIEELETAELLHDWYHYLQTENRRRQVEESRARLAALQRDRVRLDGLTVRLDDALPLLLERAEDAAYAVLDAALEPDTWEAWLRTGTGSAARLGLWNRGAGDTMRRAIRDEQAASGQVLLVPWREAVVFAIMRGDDAQYEQLLAQGYRPSVTIRADRSVYAIIAARHDRPAHGQADALEEALHQDTGMTPAGALPAPAPAPRPEWGWAPLQAAGGLCRQATERLAMLWRQLAGRPEPGSPAKDSDGPKF